MSSTLEDFQLKALYDNGSPFICDNQVGFSAGGYSLSPRSLLTWYFHPFFSRLATLTSADIAQNLNSLACSCFDSYCTFHLFPLSIFFSNRLLSALLIPCLIPLHSLAKPSMIWSTRLNSNAVSTTFRSSKAFLINQEQRLKQ